MIRHLAAPLLLVVAALCGCTAALPPAAFEGGSPKLLPEQFFAGATQSSAVLENRAGAPTRRLHVTGYGKNLPDGDFQLDQRIVFEDGAPGRPGTAEQRSWILHRLDAHRYSATLTDASGPVRAEAYGNLFHLRYAMKTPFGGSMEQWLYLQPDGRTVMNEATIRVFGVVVAHLSERITRAGEPAPAP